ncbi:MAG TPA: hypothetical protein DEV87_06325 [Clostridiales bacterium]|nr:hypothetical protein [Clostridiales bacterium]
MAYIQYRKTKKGILVARIQVSGKDPETGDFKVYPKNIQNDEGLTEAKFKKKIVLMAAEFEQQIADAYRNKVEHIHTAILTFSQLAEEWINGINNHQSHNYYLRATDICKLFNDYLKTVGLDKRPISDIKVRDVQLFINSFDKGYVKGKPIAKLKKPLPDKVNFRELDREKIITRACSYGMNNEGKNIYLDAAEQICKKYGLKFTDYFEDVTVRCLYSPETIKGYRRILRTLFNEAVRYEWITKNPVCSTKIGATKGNITMRPVEEKEVFSFKETQDFLKSLDEIFEEYIHRVIPAKIMLLCGLRIGEMCGLRWSDIDFENKLIHINRSRLISRERGVYEKDPKSKTSKRSVPVPTPLIEDLKKYYKWFEMADINFNKKLDSYYLACTIYRTPIYPGSMRNWLCNFEEKRGFKHITCHGLRHTYCSILLSQNVPIQTVSRYMGHSDSTVTLEVYAHFIPDTQEKVIDALDKLF